jgi:hypothetical protein
LLKYIESSSTWRDYPSREKLMAVGKQSGYVPFVFVREPFIEESAWLSLPGFDFCLTQCFIIILFNIVIFFSIINCKIKIIYILVNKNLIDKQDDPVDPEISVSQKLICLWHD